MRNHLFGSIAVVLAVILSSFATQEKKVKSNTTTFYLFSTPSTMISDIELIEDPSEWIFEGELGVIEPVCGPGEAEACELLVDENDTYWDGFSFRLKPGVEIFASQYSHSLAKVDYYIKTAGSEDGMVLNIEE